MNIDTQFLNDLITPKEYYQLIKEQEHEIFYQPVSTDSVSSGTRATKESTRNEQKETI